MVGKRSAETFSIVRIKGVVSEPESFRVIVPVEGFILKNSPKSVPFKERNSNEQQNPDEDDQAQPVEIKIGLTERDMTHQVGGGHEWSSFSEIFSRKRQRRRIGFWMSILSLLQSTLA